MFEASYRILGVRPTASREEIRRAYCKLALKYHPDHNQTDPQASARFMELQAAYKKLSQPAKGAASAPPSKAQTLFREVKINPSRSIAENMCEIFPDLVLHWMPSTMPDTFVFQSDKSSDDIFELADRLVNMGRFVGKLPGGISYSFGDSVKLHINAKLLARILDVRSMVDSGIARYAAPVRAANGNIRIQLDMQKICAA